MSFPVVQLDAIPSHGLIVALGDWALPACGEGLGGTPSALSGQLELRRIGRHIAVSGALAGAAESRCDRCGEPCSVSASGDIHCSYVPVGENVAVAADEDTGEVPEQGEYDGVSLDLQHVVREFFALESPPRVLCADGDPAADADCLSRFRARAGLGEPEPDPRFAALKGLKPTR